MTFFRSAIAAFIGKCGLKTISQGDLQGEYFPLSSITTNVAQNQQFIDSHLLFKNGDKYLEAGGLERDWPESRGLFLNRDKTFLVWVNEEDQLRIISMQKGANIWQVFLCCVNP